MSEQNDIADLVRAVRARVPMDAAQMLVKETPERIGAVLAGAGPRRESLPLACYGSLAEVEARLAMRPVFPQPGTSV